MPNYEDFRLFTSPRKSLVAKINTDVLRPRGNRRDPGLQFELFYDCAKIWSFAYPLITLNRKQQAFLRKSHCIWMGEDSEEWIALTHQISKAACND